MPVAFLSDIDQTPLRPFASLTAPVANEVCDVPLSPATGAGRHAVAPSPWPEHMPEEDPGTRAPPGRQIGTNHNGAQSDRQRMKRGITVFRSGFQLKEDWTGFPRDLSVRVRRECYERLRRHAAEPARRGRSGARPCGVRLRSKRGPWKTVMGDDAPLRAR